MSDALFDTYGSHYPALFARDPRQFMKSFERTEGWPFKPEQLTEDEGSCTCGEPWATLEIEGMTVTTCRAVLTGRALGVDADHSSTRANVHFNIQL